MGCDTDVGRSCAVRRWDGHRDVKTRAFSNLIPWCSFCLGICRGDSDGQAPWAACHVTHADSQDVPGRRRIAAISARCGRVTVCDVRSARRANGTVYPREARWVGRSLASSLRFLGAEDAASSRGADKFRRLSVSGGASTMCRTRCTATPPQCHGHESSPQPSPSRLPCTRGSAERETYSKTCHRTASATPFRSPRGRRSLTTTIRPVELGGK